MLAKVNFKFLFIQQFNYKSFSDILKNKFNIKMTDNCSKVFTALNKENKRGYR